MDGLSESLLTRTSQLEELAGRLKEFEEGRQVVERRLEAAKHQIEVQEALGPQVLCCYEAEQTSDGEPADQRRLLFLSGLQR